jgi:hypothetical protein
MTTMVDIETSTSSIGPSLRIPWQPSPTFALVGSDAVMLYRDYPRQIQEKILHERKRLRHTFGIQNTGRRSDRGKIISNMNDINLIPLLLDVIVSQIIQVCENIRQRFLPCHVRPIKAKPSYQIVLVVDLVELSLKWKIPDLRNLGTPTQSHHNFVAISESSRS